MVSLINRNSPKKKLKKKTDTSSEKGQVDPIPVIELDQSPKKKLKTKIDTDIEKGQVDPIPGIEMGQRSQNKNQLKELKVHVPPGKKKIQQIKLISVILVQNVSAFGRPLHFIGMKIILVSKLQQRCKLCSQNSLRNCLNVANS